MKTLLTSAKKKLAEACSKIEPSPFSSVFVRYDLLVPRTLVMLGFSSVPNDR